MLEAGVPNIIGTAGGVSNYQHQDSTNFTTCSGAFSYKELCHAVYGGAGISMWNTSFDASQSNSIYGSSTTVQPPAIQLIPQIKY